MNPTSLTQLLKLRIFNKLKSVYRYSSVHNRKESSAEHSWSALIIADYFLSTTNYNLDRLKVYELLMYHDVVEIEAGDTPIHPENHDNTKEEREQKALNSLKTKIPEPLNTKFFNLFKEFEEQKTKEAKFAKAIDSLDAFIHELDYKHDWNGWTKEFLKSKKLPYLKEFPELEKSFCNLVKYIEEKGYFNQNTS